MLQRMKRGYKRFREIENNEGYHALGWAGAPFILVGVFSSVTANKGDSEAAASWLDFTFIAAASYFVVLTISYIYYLGSRKRDAV